MPARAFQTAVARPAGRIPGRSWLAPRLYSVSRPIAPAFKQPLIRGAMEDQEHDANPGRDTPSHHRCAWRSCPAPSVTGAVRAVRASASPAAGRGAPPSSSSERESQPAPLMVHWVSRSYRLPCLAGQVAGSGDGERRAGSGYHDASRARGAGSALVLGRYSLHERLAPWLRCRLACPRRAAAPGSRAQADLDADGPAASARTARRWASARFGAPATVGLYEACSDEERLDLISELAHGETLATLIAEERSPTRSCW